MRKHPSLLAGWLFLCLALIASAYRPASAQDRPPAAISDNTFDALQYRSIGPANMGGRATDVEGVPGNPNIVYAATGTGGLFKTTNGGASWRPIFERQGTTSIGDIALEPNNPEVIWVGSGESNTRNSVSFGDGVYKSMDGGRTWQHMGLRETERVSRIVIHPRDPNTVFVGAMGHAFGPNPERGVFMTNDGGKTWQKTLYIDPEHGVADMDIDPENPNIVYAAMWSFERKPWTFRSGSDKGGLFRSIDGGRTWKKVMAGLPRMIGRMGVKVAPSNPNVVYVIMEAREGTLYRSDDRGETFRNVHRNPGIVGRGFYYTDMRVDPVNEDRVYAIATNLQVSIDGGRTFQNIAGKTHVDYHALWIDPKNPSRMWQGQDGGFAVSQDQGQTWQYVNNIALGQFYQIHADNRQPFYHVMGGLQDNGGWTGPSRTREPDGILNDDWRMVNFGDGFYVINHPDDPELYISESQGGSIVRTDMRTREQQSIVPDANRSFGGPASDVKYRFNWNSPILLSPHDKNTLYFGGNVLFRSTDFGKSWAKISPDLTTNDKEKQKPAGGPIAVENTTAEYYTTIISLAESPLRAGMVWVGTDDGNLQLTVDGGKSWTNVVKNVPGLPANSPVSGVEGSRTNADTAYASFERHMFDDFKPYIYKTTDAGKSWTNITGTLPAHAFVQVVREDPRNPNLLYAGTEVGLFASYTGGNTWVRLGLRNLPHVPVHEVLVHPRDNDLILATHGRSVWILDDATPIQQMSEQVLGSDAHLFDLRPAVRFTSRFTRYGIGDAVFTGQNPPYGAYITYYLKNQANAQTPIKIEIFDQAGKLVSDLPPAPRQPGLNRVVWDLRYNGARMRRPVPPGENAFYAGPRGPQVLPGQYTVRLTAAGKTIEKRIEVRMDPTVQVTPEELKAAYDITIKLRDMQSVANDALRVLDSVKSQLEQIDKTVKDRMPDAPKELTAAISDHQKQVDAQIGKLVRTFVPQLGYSGTGALLDQVGGLSSSVDGVNAGPTPAQREYFVELQAEYAQKMPEVTKYINESLPKLNETLRKHNAPVVIPGKPVDTSQ